MIIFTSIIQQFSEILADPFFWVITVGVVAGFIFVYYTYGHQNKGVSEEEEWLQNYLTHHGLTYLHSTEQAEAGPFAPQPIPVTKPTSIFDEQPKQKKELVCSYRTVQAKNGTGGEQAFWVKIIYNDKGIQRLIWEPKLKKVVGSQ